MSELCLNEVEHQIRARRLRQVFTNAPIGMVRDTEHLLNEGTINNLAEFLHQQYRAAAKAMERLHLDSDHRRREAGQVIHECTPMGPMSHDHGWGDCYGAKKRYFLRRAKWLLTDRPAPNGRFREKNR